MVKRLIKIFCVLFAIFIIAALVAFFYIDSIAKVAIVQATERCMGVDADLESASIGLFSGEFELNGYQISNPPDFKTPHFLNLGSGAVNITMGTLLKDHIKLPNLNLSDIEITLEENDKKTNLDVIMENINKNVGSDSSSSKPSEDSGKSDPGKHFTIQKVLLKNIKLRVALNDFGSPDNPVTIVVPEIELEKVGSKSDNGVHMKKLTGIILAATFKAILEERPDVLPQILVGQLKNAVGKIGEFGDVPVKLVGDLTNEAGNVLGKGGKLLDGAGKVIGNLGGAAAKEVLKGAGSILNRIPNPLSGGDKNKKD